jgi:hypothetical protein
MKESRKQTPGATPASASGRGRGCATGTRTATRLDGERSRPFGSGLAFDYSPEQYEQYRNLGSPFSTTTRRRAPSGTFESASQPR